MRPTPFIDDDDAYLGWIAGQRGGFVVNSYRRPTPRYLVLHRASCFTISTPSRTNWTTHAYIKLCAQRRDVLESWIEEYVGRRPRTCQLCLRQEPRRRAPRHSES